MSALFRSPLSFVHRPSSARLLAAVPPAGALLATAPAGPQPVLVQERPRNQTAGPAIQIEAGRYDGGFGVAALYYQPLPLPGLTAGRRGGRRLHRHRSPGSGRAPAPVAGVRLDAPGAGARRAGPSSIGTRCAARVAGARSIDLGAGPGRWATSCCRRLARWCASGWARATCGVRRGPTPTAGARWWEWRRGGSCGDLAPATGWLVGLAGCRPGQPAGLRPVRARAGCASATSASPTASGTTCAPPPACADRRRSTSR